MIELLLVMSMIAILVSIAVPNYQRSMKASRETVLRQNLSVLRETIQEFTLDKKRAPNSLQELVSERYLKHIPPDITGNDLTWREEQCDYYYSAEQSSGGLCDVYSGSEDIGADGTAYSSW